MTSVTGDRGYNLKSDIPATINLSTLSKETRQKFNQKAVYGVWNDNILWPDSLQIGRLSWYDSMIIC